jgi:hypothetical protein
VPVGLVARRKMITETQCERLRMEFARTHNMDVSALKAGVDRKTARKYLNTQSSPQELQKPHRWRTRSRTGPLTVRSSMALKRTLLEGSPVLGHTDAQASASACSRPVSWACAHRRASAINASSISCYRFKPASLVGTAGRDTHLHRDLQAVFTILAACDPGWSRRTPSSPPGSRSPQSAPPPRSSPATPARGHSERARPR